jgi:hypothetical protein
MKIIPFSPSISSRQNFSVNLGELVCEFTMAWNSRASAWFCDFKTSTGENDSVRLVENSSLLEGTNRTGLDGDFRVLKFNKLCNDPITYDNLGSDWRLVFATRSEWEVFDGV